MEGKDCKPLREVIIARGHSNVAATHRTTFEITKEDRLTPQGDCIIAVSADRCFQDFSLEFLQALKDENTLLEIKMLCDGLEEKVTAYGHPGLTFTNLHEMVVRKSTFTCGRTLAIKADKAACDLNKELVKKLSEGKTLTVELKISPAFT
jgi:hypothetical protein